MNKVLKYIFHISVLFLIVISLWPGSLIGFLLYNDWSLQPHLIQNPFGTTINHFICYLCISLMGFFIYAKNENFKNLVYGLFFLSITLEIFHSIIPNRSFQLQDLLANIFGVMVAYFVIRIYLFFNKP